MPSSNGRKISFPADSVLSAVIQDGDTCELCKILHNQRGEFNINQANHVGLTALHHAVLSNNLDAVKMLLCGNSDVNAQDVHGFSPLHTASACGFLQISSILIVFGADVFSLTKQFELPVDVAKDISIVRLLTVEMYSRIQNELYVQTYVTAKLMQCWSTFRKLVMFVIRMLHTMFVNFRQRHSIPAVPGQRQRQSITALLPEYSTPVSNVNSENKLTLTANNNKHRNKNKPVVKID